jgi:hypothetical protein
VLLLVAQPPERATSPAGQLTSTGVPVLTVASLETTCTAAGWGGVVAVAVALVVAVVAVALAVAVT